MQHKIRSFDGPLHPRITTSDTKAITNRALLLAALAEGTSQITNLDFNEQTKAFIFALQQAGIVIEIDTQNKSCLVTGCSGKLPKKQATIWCHHSKMITRFILTACAASSGVYYFDGTPDLRQLNISKQLNLLCRQGAQSIPSDNEKLPVTLLGADSLGGGELIFSKQSSSAIISSFLILAPFARTPFTFTMPHPSHQHYLDMTCEMMADFGVLVHRIHQGQLMIPVPQRYQARDYQIIGN